MNNKNIKIFQTADLHIGMMFSRYPEGIKKDLQKARVDTLNNMVIKANKEECNIFVIAGDLFDKVNGISKKLIREVSEILNIFSGQCILILPGNHDYDNGMIDLWTNLKENSPDSVIFINEEKPYFLDDYGIKATIYPAPCHAKHSETNNLDWIKNEEFDDDRINIGIAHGAIIDISPDLYNQYFNMTFQELNSIPLDLWLLGHTHIPYPANNQVSDIKIFNPGTPEPDGLDCKHEGNAWIINIDQDKNISASRTTTGTYKFIDKEYEINDEDDLDKVTDDIIGTSPERTIARITLKGRINEDTMDYYSVIYNKLNKELGFLITDVNDLGVKITPEKIHNEFSEGSFPQELLLSLSDDENTLQLAYELIMEVKDDN